jgi:poly-gamma-glutamate capsule biosynthesis protein CapA/YwtB (metallophosphatase superfamily)
MVRSSFSGSKQALGADIGAQKNYVTSKATQNNLIGGITGPAAATLVNRAGTDVAIAGQKSLMNLNEAQRQQEYNAALQDKALQTQTDQANNQVFAQGMQGAGSLLGGIISLVNPLAGAGVKAATNVASDAVTPQQPATQPTSQAPMANYYAPNYGINGPGGQDPNLYNTGLNGQVPNLYNTGLNGQAYNYQTGRYEKLW